MAADRGKRKELKAKHAVRGEGKETHFLCLYVIVLLKSTIQQVTVMDIVSQKRPCPLSISSACKWGKEKAYQ